MLSDKKTNLKQEEVWNDGSIGGGSGFSNRFGRPLWQEDAFISWYNRSKNEHKLPSNSSWWNKTGRVSYIKKKKKKKKEESIFSLVFLIT